ncbi:MAG: hypothetical protein M1818_000450 [Claussenomyces sp. TS43310]|nr:MAG: hypothetical protein M1818_000450 [Claussenomyces sp. TS43310]
MCFYNIPEGITPALIIALRADPQLYLGALIVYYAEHVVRIGPQKVGFCNSYALQDIKTALPLIGKLRIEFKGRSDSLINPRPGFAYPDPILHPHHKILQAVNLRELRLDYWKLPSNSPVKYSLACEEWVGMFPKLKKLMLRSRNIPKRGVRPSQGRKELPPKTIDQITKRLGVPGRTIRVTGLHETTQRYLEGYSEPDFNPRDSRICLRNSVWWEVWFWEAELGQCLRWKHPTSQTA